RMTRAAHGGSRTSSPESASLSQHPSPPVATAPDTELAPPATRIQSAALSHWHPAASLDGMTRFAAMPAPHHRKALPIRPPRTSATLYPFLVGSAIGCGIAVSPIKLKRTDPEKLAARFPDLDRTPDDDDPAWDVVEGDTPAGHTEGL